jgi:hypothetical protein
MDNKDKQDLRDRTRVNTNEDYEVRYWSNKFGVSADELKAAAKATKSESVKEIEEFLRNNSQSK